MPFLIVAVALAAWFVFGNPTSTIAGWLWKDSAAPWETVDAFYYPNRNDFTVDVSSTGLSSVDECRDWVNAEAARRGDAELLRGDYECGVGKSGMFGDIAVYRITAK